MQAYRVTLQSDSGKRRILSYDNDPQIAAQRVCAAEGAPYPTAVVKVEPIAPTPAELKARVESGSTDRHFFTRDTMRFFGDTMSNYGVRSKPVEVTTPSGDTVTCWALYRKRPVKHGMQKDAYFAVDTFKRVLSASE